MESMTCRRRAAIAAGEAGRYVRRLRGAYPALIFGVCEAALIHAAGGSPKIVQSTGPSC